MRVMAVVVGDPPNGAAAVSFRVMLTCGPPAHREPLNGAVVLGDDEIGLLIVAHGRAHPDGTAQVDDEDGDAANVGDALMLWWDGSCSDGAA